MRHTLTRPQQTLYDWLSEGISIVWKPKGHANPGWRAYFRDGSISPIRLPVVAALKSMGLIEEHNAGLGLHLRLVQGRVEPDSKLIHSFEYWDIASAPMSRRVMLYSQGEWIIGMRKTVLGIRAWVRDDAATGWAILIPDPTHWTEIENLAPSIDKAKP